MHQQSLVRYIKEPERCFVSVEDWLKYWEVESVEGKVKLYKAVTPEFRDFHTGRVNYSVGTVVVAPDWDENYAEECGCALHCSPYLFCTHQYVPFGKKHVHIELEVDLKDIRIVEQPTYVDKVRVKQATVLKIVKDA